MMESKSKGFAGFTVANNNKNNINFTHTHTYIHSLNCGTNAIPFNLSDLLCASEDIKWMSHFHQTISHYTQRNKQYLNEVYLHYIGS